MIPHNITKRSFKYYLVKAGLSREIRFHDTRHTAATLLLASGVNVKVVSEMLGHSSGLNPEDRTTEERQLPSVR
jgi:site-specific recombinase XerD